MEEGLAGSKGGHIWQVSYMTTTGKLLSETNI